MLHRLALESKQNVYSIPRSNLDRYMHALGLRPAECLHTCKIPVPGAGLPHCYILQPAQYQVLNIHYLQPTPEGSTSLTSSRHATKLVPSWSEFYFDRCQVVLGHSFRHLVPNFDSHFVFTSSGRQCIVFEELQNQEQLKATLLDDFRVTLGVVRVTRCLVLS